MLVSVVDTHCMMDFELEQLFENLDWQLVLIAYTDEVASVVQQTPDDQGWVQRIKDVDQVMQDQLPRIHGKLIALGFLKFELGDRQAGMKYQLTNLGRQAVARLKDRTQSNAA